MYDTLIAFDGPSTAKFVPILSEKVPSEENGLIRDGGKTTLGIHNIARGKKRIDRTLSTNPEFIVLDEPTSALDVSVQAQIFNLLIDLQDKYGLTYLFITHHLLVVGNISDRIAVMYLGKIVEVAATGTIFKNTLKKNLLYVFEIFFYIYINLL